MKAQRPSLISFLSFTSIFFLANAWSELGAATTAGSASNTPHYIGINMGGTADYSPERLFSDVMKMAREWYKPGKVNSGNSADYAPHDADGWPTQDAGLVLWDLNTMHGAYKLSFTGQATIGFEYSSCTVTNLVYNPSTNTTSEGRSYEGKTMVKR